MQIQCPQCQNQYDIETDFSQATWVCHRCGHEYNPLPCVQINDQTNHDQTTSAVDSPQWHCAEHLFPSPPFLTAKSGHQDDIGQQAGEPGTPLADSPPQRKNVHIWPWLLVMLIVTTSTGFWMQHEQWLDNRWVRSTLMNLNMPMQQRDKDWSITPESVQPEWVLRSDGSKVLLIHGKLNNLLACELLAPDVEVTFYAQHQPDQILEIQRFPVSMQPDEHAIKQVPFIKPEADTMPIGPLSSREFTLVVESVASGSGDFSLSVNVE